MKTTLEDAPAVSSWEPLIAFEDIRTPAISADFLPGWAGQLRGRVRRIFLNKCSRQAKVCESLDCFCAVSVSAQAAGWDALVPE